MATVLFFVYLCVFLWLISKLRFFKKSGLPAILLISLFLVRVLAGVVNCYLSYHYFSVSDSLTFHTISLNENYLLLHQPKYFIKEFFSDGYGQHYGGLFNDHHSFWNNLKTNLIVKNLAVLNIFTLRNFYTNTLFFNFIVFAGSVALYSAVQPLFRKRNALLIFAVFLLPSAIFYTSGIQKDGLILMFIGFLVYGFSAILNTGLSFKRILVCLFSFFLIFFLRNFVAIVLLPALILWFLQHKFSKQKKLILFSIPVLCVIVFFGSSYIKSPVNFPKLVSERGSTFDELSRTSKTYIPVGIIDPNISGFIKIAPEATLHGFLYPSPFYKLETVPFSVEIYFIWAVFIVAIIRKKKKSDYPPVLWALAFFSIVNILIIGYTIPNLGALLRYRSIYLQMLLICFAYYYQTSAKHQTAP